MSINKTLKHSNSSLPYSHLNEETNKIMEKGLNEKIAWARKKHFVYHDKAKGV